MLVAQSSRTVLGLSRIGGVTLSRSILELVSRGRRSPGVGLNPPINIPQGRYSR